MGKIMLPSVADWCVRTVLSIILLSYQPFIGPLTVRWTFIYLTPVPCMSLTIQWRLLLTLLALEVRNTGSCWDSPQVLQHFHCLLHFLELIGDIRVGWCMLLTLLYFSELLSWFSYKLILFFKKNRNLEWTFLKRIFTIMKNEQLIIIPHFFLIFLL